VNLCELRVFVIQKFKKPYFRINRGVPCQAISLAETQAEIIPVERFAHTLLRNFHVPEPDNAGVGKE